jgi:hypothetical protein
MEQSNSCETDPPEILRRLESIQCQRALIDDLATRLKAAQLEHDHMERELNEYRASIAPIRKCPEEVLLMIFKSFADAAPELVAGLLQVCKCVAPEVRQPAAPPRDTGRLRPRTVLTRL